jgi:hypothetical protein
MKYDWQDRFLSFTEKKKRKTKLTKEGIPKKKYKRRTQYTREEFIDYVQDNFIYTLAKFDRFTAENQDAPSRYFLRKYFGNWTNLKKELYGVGKKAFIKPDRVIKLCADLKILRWRKYIEHRKKEKDLFPSWRYVNKQYGSWHNLRRMISGRMISSIQERYMVLSAELGKVPTIKECEKAGVEIEYMLSRIPENKKHLDELNAIIMEWSNATKRRDR